jgi:hypothetical protein
MPVKKYIIVVWTKLFNYFFKNQYEILRILTYVQPKKYFWLYTFNTDNLCSLFYSYYLQSSCFYGSTKHHT